MRSKSIILSRLLPLISLLLTITSSKVFQNVLTMQNLRNNDGWNYLGRMFLNPGKVTISLTLELKFIEDKAADYQFQFVAVPNFLWKQQLQNKCQLVNYTAQNLALKAQKQIVLSMLLTKSSGYRTITTKIVDLTQTTLYNFVLRDCSQSLVKEGFDRRTKVQFKLDVMSNDQHLSAHEESYTYILPIIMLLEGAIILLLRWDKEQDGQNWTKYLLKLSLWIAIGSLGFKYLGHIVYFLTGHHYEFFQILYLLIHSASDSLILFLLTLLSFGWTVTFYNHKDLDIYIPLGCMCGFIYIILTIMNNIPEGHDKYHMFDTIPAYIMIFFRMAIFTVFIFGVIRSMAKTPHSETKIKSYFVHLAVMGTIYMIFVPLAFMLIELVEQEKREHLMMLGLEIGRLILLGWLAILSGWKNSSYRKVLDSSFMEKESKYY